MDHLEAFLFSLDQGGTFPFPLVGRPPEWIDGGAPPGPTSLPFLPPTRSKGGKPPARYPRGLDRFQSDIV